MYYVLNPLYDSDDAWRNKRNAKPREEMKKMKEIEQR